MVEEPTDDRENAEADEDGASAPVPEKVRFFYALKVLFRFSLSFSFFRKWRRCFDESAPHFSASTESDLKLLS